MNSREHVAAAPKHEEPDQVPDCELGIDRPLAQRIMGWPTSAGQTGNLEANTYFLTEAKAIASLLHLDNITYVLRATAYAHKMPSEDGRLFYGPGMIHSEADLERLQLPDPHDDSLYAEAAEFVQHKEDFSAWLVTRIGIFPTMFSLGIQNFSLALENTQRFVEAVLDLYCDWSAFVAERVCQLGFDVFVSADYMAFKTGPFFSPAVFQELVLPRFVRIRDKITIPWLIHSYGNLEPFMDDLLNLGIAGLHPFEQGAMDMRAAKRNYGARICLMGNVDLNILGLGTPADVDRTVYELIRDIGPGGGYIVACGNSLAAYLQPQNVMALGAAVQKYGRYPLALRALLTRKQSPCLHSRAAGHYPIIVYPYRSRASRWN